MATRAEQKGLESFDPKFGEATAEWTKGGVPLGFATTAIHRPFLFYAHAVDGARRLEIVVSDFDSYTFGCGLSVDELDDMRDDIGVGGPWSGFVDYVANSLASDDVKILLDCSLAAGDAGDYGAMTAKLIARKAKGIPRVTFSLSRLLNSSASDSIANLSLSLYRAFKENRKDVIKERDHNIQLTRQLCSAKEKNEDLQKQLDAYTFKSKQTLYKSKIPEKTLPVSENASNFDCTLNSERQQPSDVASSKDSPSTKTGQRIVRARRATTRGALLQDHEHNNNI